MMVNVNKLKGKIVENGMTVSSLASKAGITESTFFRRLSENGESFTVGEVDRISRILNLSAADVNSIFFSQLVA